MSSKRKELMAALDAALRLLNDADEFEADNKAQRTALESARAGHEQEKAQLAKTKAAAAEADAEHVRWREVNAKERAKGNAANDQIQRQNELLVTQNKDLRAEQQNILDGIAALRQRLKVG